MNKDSRYLLPLLLVVLTILSAVGAGRKPRGISKQDAEKSRYLYYQGVTQMSVRNNDGAYEYFRRAVDLNPDNNEARMMLGPLRMSLRNPEVNDSAWNEVSLDMMRDYVERYPDDFEENLQYAILSSARDSMTESVRVLEQMLGRDSTNTMVLAYLSQAYGHQGETSKAVNALTRYEDIEGRNPAITLQKVSLLMEGRDTVGALKEVDGLISANPSDYSGYVLKGNLYEVLSNLDSAENMYEKAMRLAPMSSEPMVALMDVYKSRGDSAAYENMLYDVLLTDNMGIDQKVALLSEYLQTVVEKKSDTQRGDYLFSVLRDQNPHEPAVMQLAARYSAAKSDFADAADQIRYALDMDRQNAELWQQLIFYLANAEKNKEAIKAYEEADTLINLPNPMRLYGGLLLQQEDRYDDAMALYRGIIHKIAPDFNISGPLDIKRDLPRDISLENLDFMSSVLTSMGDCAYNMKDTLNAFNDYRNALTLDPENALTANNYAYFLCQSGGDLDKAYELSNMSLRGAQAENPTYLDTNAWILYLKGDYEKALEQQSRAIAIMEENDILDDEALDHYGDILQKTGDFSKALIYWEKALETKPSRAGMKEKIEKIKKEIKKKQ